VVAFATPGDLATFVGRDFTAQDTATATLLLDIATAAVRDWTGQTLSAVTGDVVTLDPPTSGRLFLPELPVTAVASVVYAGTALTLGSTSNTYGYYWYGDTGIIRVAGIFNTAAYAPQSVVVTYSHGYATIPDAIKGVCLELAAELLTVAAQPGLRSEAIGNYKVEFDSAVRTVAEIAGGRLDRYRRLVVA